MAQPGRRDGDDARVFDLATRRPVDPEPLDDTEQAGEASFDLVLDEETPDPSPPVQVDLPTGTVSRRPVIPTHLRTAAGVRKAVATTSGRAGYRAAFHGVRLSLYLPLGLFWALVGVFRLLGRHLRWAWHPELSTLLREAANTADLKAGPGVQRQLAAARKARFGILAGELVALAVAVLIALALAPWWLLALAVAVGVPALAHIGRPAGKPIVQAAVLTPRHRRLNLDVVATAYYKARLGDPDKPGQQIRFPQQMARDGGNTGSQVVIDLPHGRTFSEAMAAREKIASGLDVTVSQVYLTADKTSNRRHLLWVADVDPLGIPAGRTPLLDCKPRDIWRPMPLGLDERGRRVLLPLVFTSILVGAQPRKGKTFTARAIALFAALDPYVRLSVFDGKGSPDWRKFALVAHTFGFGLLPDRIQGDPIETLRATLRAAKTDVLRRNAKLSELPTSVCPEGKLTRDIARDPRYGMPVWLIVLDEFQEFLNTGDDDADLEIADLLLFLVKVGPSVGVVVISSTQKPSGLGSTGKVAKRFTDYRDQHLTRFALKTGNYNVSESVLGSGSYSEGYDASALPVGDGTNGTFDYRGIGILYDSPVGNATVRTYLADGADAEKILHAARVLRERAGTLDGMAAGEQVAAQARDPLADALDSMHAGEASVSWAQLATRLAEQLPERYAGITKEALSNTLTGLKLGIESKNVRDQFDDGKVVKGVHRAALVRALERRNSDEN